MRLDNCINKIKCKVKTLKGISLLQVGSCLNNKKFNDIDFLLICDNLLITKHNVDEIFNEYKSSFSDDAIKIYNYCQYEISIAFYTYKKVNEILFDYYTGNKVLCEHRIWTIGYWMAETFINEIRNSKILIDSNNYVSKIKKITVNDSIYGNNKILLDCYNEILLKRNIIKNSKNNNEIEYLNNDILYATMRSKHILNNGYMKDFKNIDSKVNTDIILSKIYDQINYVNCTYLGTWQFSGDFKKMSENEIISLIKLAKEKGIKKFDTALVYGKGKVEKILSKVLEKSDIVLTKIPAKIKPSALTLPLNNYYDYNYIIDCAQQSLDNLRREKIDILLLHNWHSNWNNEPLMIKYLQKLKSEKYVDKIGISLPNSYNNTLPNNILSLIDVLEVPYNEENKWIIKDLNRYKFYNVEIILRSLFLQGKALQNDNDYIKILKKAKKLQTSIAIGMTTSDQIEKNIKVLEKLQ